MNIQSKLECILVLTQLTILIIIICQRFKMDLFQMALNANQLGNLGFINNNNMSGNEKLREQLYHCTYSDETKFVIEKSIKQVLHVYPHFQTQILQFTEQGQQKRFIQIKGIMQIQIRGKNCKVDYNMMLPSAFPRKPPYVRIINKNPDYIVDDFYKDLRSPTDPKSFILNTKLSQVQNWNEGSSIVNIIIESNNMMRSKFPFYKPAKSMTSSGANINAGWASLNQQNNNAWGSSSQHNYGNNVNQGFNNMNQGFNNQGFNNQGFNNQGFNNQGFNNQGFNNQGFNNQGFNNQGLNNYNPPPPIPFNGNAQNINQIIINGQKFVGQSKKIIQKMKTQQIKSIQKIQHLQTIKSSLDSEQSYLRKQNMQMSQFLRKNQKQQFKDLSTFIKPKDQRSEQILNLVSSLKARDDCITLLEERFSANEFSFEQFVRVVKKLQEQKFEQKVLLLKCTQI